MNRFKALVTLIIAAYVLDQFSPGSGGMLMLGAFVLWLVMGDGRTQFGIAWKKFMNWLPS